MNKSILSYSYGYILRNHGIELLARRSYCSVGRNLVDDGHVSHMLETLRSLKQTVSDTTRVPFDVLVFLISESLFFGGLFFACVSLFSPRVFLTGGVCLLPVHPEIS